MITISYHFKKFLYISLISTCTLSYIILKIGDSNTTAANAGIVTGTLVGALNLKSSKPNENN